VVEHGLGRAMSESFYFPYVRKLWGVAPEELAVTLARRRISGSSIGKIESGGTIRKNGSSWGSASSCCGDHGSKRTVAAVLVFFSNDFF